MLRRLIPAHAGKTVRVTLACHAVLAHPRSRGENRLAVRLASEMGGSSPLTRGKQYRARYGPFRGGLIPAHAGKTVRVTLACHAVLAHPRSRGENSRSRCPRIASSGSSPLTRGKHAYLPLLNCPIRLIPAHAGKTTPTTHLARHYRAHPRSRGENHCFSPFGLLW